MLSDFFAVFLLSLISLNRYLSGGVYIPWVIYLLSFVLVVLYRNATLNKRELFVQQLKSERKSLRNGGTVVVDGELVRYQTPVSTYFLVIGFLTSTIVVPSKFRTTKGGENIEAFFYSILSLLFGWWALPYGPLVTISVLQKNFSGGRILRIGELIDFRRAAPELPYVSKEVLEEEYDDIENSDVSMASTGFGSSSNKLLLAARPAPKSLSLEDRLVLSVDQPIGYRVLESFRQNISQLKEHRQERAKRLSNYRAQQAELAECRNQSVVSLKIGKEVTPSCTLKDTAQAKATPEFDFGRQRSWLGNLRSKTLITPKTTAR